MGNWKMGKMKRSRICVLCKKDVDDELKFGILKTTKNLRVHYYCLLLSETISQSGEDDEGILGFMPMDIVKEINRSKSRKCCYCNEKMASLGCARASCNRKFHLYCGYLNNVVFNFDNFTSLCNLHSKSSNVPVHIKKSLTDYHCLICFDVFNADTKLSDVLWANCCKSDVVLHIDCLRQMALSAGYFTKCPGCNDKTEFLKTIKARGVFVPERDASWELDGDAFSELLYVHNTCDVENCSCPDGRNYNGESGMWKIMLCKMCGSVGAHVGCSPSKRKFLCKICNLNRDVTTESANNDISIPSSSNSTSFENLNDNDSDEETIEIEDTLPEFETNSNIEIDKTDSTPTNAENSKRKLDVSDDNDENIENLGMCKKFKNGDDALQKKGVLVKWKLSKAPLVQIMM